MDTHPQAHRAQLDSPSLPPSLPSAAAAPPLRLLALPSAPSFFVSPSAFFSSPSAAAAASSFSSSASSACSSAYLAKGSGGTEAHTLRFQHPPSRISGQSCLLLAMLPAPKGAPALSRPSAAQAVQRNNASTAEKANQYPSSLARRLSSLPYPTPKDPQTPRALAPHPSPKLVGTPLVHAVDPALVEVDEEDHVVAEYCGGGARRSVQSALSSCTTARAGSVPAAATPAGRGPCGPSSPLQLSAPDNRCSSGILMTKANRSSMMVFRNLRRARHDKCGNDKCFHGVHVAPQLRPSFAHQRLARGKSAS